MLIGVWLGQDDFARGSVRMTFRRCALALVFAVMGVGCATYAVKPLSMPLVGKWDRFELLFESTVAYANPVQDVVVEVTFTGPSGEVSKVDGFWDGTNFWKARFSPPELGTWKYETYCSDTRNQGLHLRSGRFLATAPKHDHRFTRHGPVRVHRSGRYFEHHDGTPFFWLGDTAWSGPLQASDAEWDDYLRERNRQKFTAILWAATPDPVSTGGDRFGEPAFVGDRRIAINPAFFQRLDRRVEAMNAAGFLSVPVMIWDNPRRPLQESRRGLDLPEDQVIVLARYMAARWAANPGAWLLHGDGDYRGARADRWRRIGRAVFGNISHAPVGMHSVLGQWLPAAFQGEMWLDFHGYRSGHDQLEENLRWIVSGPATVDWRRPPYRPFLSLEGPYENQRGPDGVPMRAEGVRRAHYWSLLNAPTCGVVYGGEGVWGRDSGSVSPIGQAREGVAPAWWQSVRLEGAEHMKWLADFFSRIEFYRLRPDQRILMVQPGELDVKRFVSASRTENRDLTVLYSPEDSILYLRPALLPAAYRAVWFSPRSGSVEPAVGRVQGEALVFEAPRAGVDWLLKIEAATSLEGQNR